MKWRHDKNGCCFNAARGRGRGSGHQDARSKTNDATFPIQDGLRLGLLCGSHVAAAGDGGAVAAGGDGGVQDAAARQDANTGHRSNELVVVDLQQLEGDLESTTGPGDEANAPAEADATTVDHTGADAEAARADVAAGKAGAASCRSNEACWIACPCRPCVVRPSGPNTPA